MKQSRRAALQPKVVNPQLGVRAGDGALESVKPAAPRTNLVVVCLEFVQPGAREVFVAGSFNGWKPERSPLLHRGNGHWVRDLAVGAGRHEYQFVVDGKWLPDPNAKESVQNPFGGKNSVLAISE